MEDGQTIDPLNQLDIDERGINDQQLITGNTDVIESLLKDDNVPEEIKQKWFWVYNRDNVLTFIDLVRRNDKLLSFDLLKVDFLNSIPYFDYDYNKEFEWNVIKLVFETKLDRATGIRDATGIKNERIIQQTQFGEQRVIQENKEIPAVKSSFISKILRRGR